jgi:hypothetical protein
MPDIRLSDPESALWREVGTRGDAFRRATRDRASEQLRLHGRMIEILDYDGRMLDSIKNSDPSP